MKKKENTKEYLMEVMGKLDPTFKPRLNEWDNTQGLTNDYSSGEYYEDKLEQLLGEMKADGFEYDTIIDVINKIYPNGQEYKTHTNGLNVPEDNIDEATNNSGFQRATSFLIYSKDGEFYGITEPVENGDYMSDKYEVLETPEFQNFAQKNKITPEMVGRIRKEKSFTMNGNPLSSEHYEPSDSMELFDDKTNTWYNLSGQTLRNPREYKPDDEGGYTPFGDEGDY